MPGTITVGWTGHRKLADESKIKKAVDEVLDRLATVAGIDRTATQSAPQRLVGVGSIAIGADTVVAEALQRREIPLLVVLPFPLDRFEPDADSAARGRIVTLANAAQSINTIHCGLSDDEAFMEAGTWMVERADVLIAIWDGAPSKGLGGTRDVIDIASKLNVPIIQIHPETGVIDWPPLNTLKENQEHLPLLRTRQDALTFFAQTDTAAKEMSGPSRLVLFWIILLHLAAVAIAIFVSFLESILEKYLPGHASSRVAGVLKVGALGWALFLALRYRPKHRGWLDARMAAELCRSFLSLWNMRRDTITLPPSPTMSTDALRRELEIAWLLDQPNDVDLETAKKTYLEGPGDDANRMGRVVGQCDYFSHEKEKAHALCHKLEYIAMASTIMAILSGILTLVFSFLHIEGGWYATTKALSIVLPLATAAMLSYATARDLTRRAARFHEMAERLEQLKLLVASAKTWNSLGRSVSSLESLLLQEVGEWHAFTRYAGDLHG